MTLEKNNSSMLVFDGTIEDMKNQLPSFNMDGHKYFINPENIISAVDAINDEEIKGVDNIANALGFDVSDLGFAKVYHGCRKGLKLAFYKCNEKILILSFGEFQSGRFICYFEGFVR